MAFTKALYYPYIDVRDETWLKNAFLYWDTIETIVPESMDEPYQNNTSMGFYEAGVLKPCIVSPDMPVMREVEAEVLMYLGSPEGIGVLADPHGPDRLGLLHVQKLPHELRRIVHLHSEKLPYKVLRQITEITGNHLDPARWLPVDVRFASYYMTLLATRISDQIGSGMLTSTQAYDALATTARLDSRLQVDDTYGFGGGRYHVEGRPTGNPDELAQGLLAHLCMRDITVADDTPVETILDFRRDHAPALARFRTKIAELTGTVGTDKPLPAWLQQINDLYTNEVKPACDDLKQALQDARIKHSTKGLLKVSFLSTGAASVPLVLAGMAVPQALLAGIGVSLIGTTVLYNVEKRKTLRDNPYSYLLALEDAFP